MNCVPHDLRVLVAQRSAVVLGDPAEDAEREPPADEEQVLGLLRRLFRNSRSSQPAPPRPAA